MEFILKMKENYPYINIKDDKDYDELIDLLLNSTYSYTNSRNA